MENKLCEYLIKFNWEEMIESEDISDDEPSIELVFRTNDDLYTYNIDCYADEKIISEKINGYFKEFYEKDIEVYDVTVYLSTDYNTWEISIIYSSGIIEEDIYQID